MDSVGRSGQNSFWIELDNSTRCFLPGQLVSGNVKVNFASEKTVKRIVVKLFGLAEVHWTERYRSHGEWKTRHYRSVEKYFHTKINVVENGVIPSGVQSYRFGYILPRNIPSSFVGLHGMVLYKVEAIVKRSWRFDNKVKLPFTVNGLLDLNLITVPRVSQALDERVHQFSGLCTRSGLVGFHLRVPRSGYVPGENILFTAELTNDSSRNVEQIKVYLLQKITYRAQGQARRQEHKLCKIQGPSIDPGEREIWSGSLRIPAIPPTNLAGCKIINVSYEFKMTMDLPTICWTSTIRKRLPITIGTIPLRETFQAFPYENQPNVYVPYYYGQQFPSSPSPPNIPNNNSHLWQAPPPGDPPPTTTFSEAYPDIPPPTYEECMMMTSPYVRPSYPGHVDSDSDSESRDAHHVAGPSAPNASEVDGHFIPRYITYSFPPPPPYTSK